MRMSDLMSVAEEKLTDCGEWHLVREIGHGAYGGVRRRHVRVHAKEVRDLKMKSEAKGLTLVPLKIFLKRGRVKVELGVCRGKALHDKRDALKKKALQRDAAC